MCRVLVCSGADRKIEDDTVVDTRVRGQDWKAVCRMGWFLDVLVFPEALLDDAWVRRSDEMSERNGK